MSRQPSRTNAHFSLGLLVVLNLFNFVDRYTLAAVEPSIRASFFSPNNPNAMWWSGTLGTAFVISYMISAPAVAWLADRYSRWVIIGVAAVIWSMATAASGLTLTIGGLFIARIFVGIGEGAYGPAAPPIISDLFAAANRSTMLAIFFAAIPIGSALGYFLGGLINIHLGWRTAFYIVSVPGLVLGLVCFLQKDVRRTNSITDRDDKARPYKYLQSVIMLTKTRSYGFNVAAQTAMAFVLGGLAYWMPAYLQFRHQPAAAIPVLGALIGIAGLTSTLTGGFLADRLRNHLRGSDLVISGVGMLAGFPLLVTMLYVPFPLAWLFLFAALFFIFFNTGPSNAAVANVSLPSIRAMGFGLNIFVMHALGDAIAPPLLGLVAGHTNMNLAFLTISVVMLVSGALWLFGARYLQADMAKVEATEHSDSAVSTP
jgi:MFS transporter, Spinster family, sphingosine-1-phosphate transporter